MRLLAWRGVTVRRTKFGIALLFDTADEDGTPVRMLNVNGTFQSACYLDERIWNELVCMYHRTSAEVVLGLVRLRRACVIGGGGFSFPKKVLYKPRKASILTQLRANVRTYVRLETAQRLEL